MTRHEMPAGAGHPTPGSDEALSRDQAAQGSKGQTTTDPAIVADPAGQRKAVGLTDKVMSTLQAEGALQGYEVIYLDDGRCLACHWGWCKVLRNVRDLARFLGKGWIV